MNIMAKLVIDVRSFFRGFSSLKTVFVCGKGQCN